MAKWPWWIWPFPTTRSRARYTADEVDQICSEALRTIEADHAQTLEHVRAYDKSVIDSLRSQTRGQRAIIAAIVEQYGDPEQGLRVQRTGIDHWSPKDQIMEREDIATLDYILRVKRK